VIYTAKVSSTVPTALSRGNDPVNLQWGVALRRFCALSLGLLSSLCSAEGLMWGYGPADTMPYVGLVQQQVQHGLAYHLSQEISKRFALPVEFLETPNNRLEPYLQQGRLHLVCNTNPEWVSQPQQYHWSPALYDEEDVLLQRMDQPELTGLTSLYGKVLGTSLGYTYSQPLMGAFATGKVSRQDVRDLDTSLHMLDKDRLSAVIDMQRNLAYKLAQHPQMQLRFSPWVVQRYQVYCAYSRHLPIPAEQLDALLQELLDQHLIEQWLDEALRSATDRPVQHSADAQ